MKLTIKPLALMLMLFALCSCNKQIIGSQEQMGQVKIILSGAATKAAPVPAPEDFWIDIFNGNNMRIYSKSYPDTKDVLIPLNAGEYTLLACFGDSLAVGFDKPFYVAKEAFTVHGQTSEQLNVTAKLGNVKVNVVYDQTLPSYYEEGYYVVVKHCRLKGKSLKFNADETRSGFIPAGPLAVEVYAKIDGTWKYYASEAEVYDPQDEVTFTISAGVRYGSLNIGIHIDSDTEDIDKNIDVDISGVSSEAPSITPFGFDQENSFTIEYNRIMNGTSGIEKGLYVSFKAPKGFGDVSLSTDSDIMAGIPSNVLLSSPSESERQALENYGFFWAFDGPDGVLDFSTVIPELASKAVSAEAGALLASFTLNVQDYTGSSREAVFKIKKGLVPSATLSIPQENVWATKMYLPSPELQNANAALQKVEMSTDKVKWSEAASGNYANGTLIGDLQPDTDYWVRLMYDGVQLVEPFKIRTESAQQIANSGFEDWTTLSHDFKVALTGAAVNINWYQPFLNESESWWAVNSKKSLVSSAAAGANYNMRRFPVVVYSTDAASGSKSASLQVVAISSGMTTTNLFNASYHIGELFIGKSDGNGNHSSDGHAFASRPSALKFKYKYSAYAESDRFQVEAYIKLADGTKITATKEGSASSSWAEFTLPFEYSVINSKASEIYVSIRTVQSASSSNVSSSLVSHEIAGGYEEAKFGSELRVDDITLIYE